MSSSDVFALRRRGMAAEALALARDAVRRGGNDLWLLRAYAWVLYDQLKDIVAHYEAGRLPPMAMSQQVTTCLREFCTFGRPLRGDAACSQMVRLALKVSRDWTLFLKFARWVGVDGLSDADREGFTNAQGKAVDNLHTRFVRAVCRALVRQADDALDPALQAWAEGVLEEALRASPDDLWCNYYRSKLLLAQGHADRAVRSLLPVLTRQSRAAWAWALLGETLAPSSTQDAIDCLRYATLLAREEQEIARVRIRLAALLLQAGLAGEAAMHVRTALAWREANGYGVPSALAQLAGLCLHATPPAAQQPASGRRDAALALLHCLQREDLSYAKGVIVDVNLARAMSFVATAAGDLRLYHDRIPGIAALPAGAVVEIGCTRSGGQPVHCRLADDPSLPGLREAFSGQLRLCAGRGFAFVHCAAGTRVYVPANLLQSWSPQDRCALEVVAVRQQRRDGQAGWRAVSVTPAH